MTPATEPTRREKALAADAAKRLTGRCPRRERLLPGGVPRWVRCYDNGGRTADRYSVVLTGRYRRRRPGGHVDPFLMLSMDAQPDSPAGVGLITESAEQPDGWFTRDRVDLGKRVKFGELPERAQAFTLEQYRRLWNL